MLTKKLIENTLVLHIAIILFFLQGCATKIIPVDIKPISFYEPSNKVAFDVAFICNDELEEFSYLLRWPGGIDSNKVYLDKLLYDENTEEKKSFRYNSTAKGVSTIQAGNILRKNTEIILKSVFSNATTFHVKGKENLADNDFKMQSLKKKFPPNIVGIIEVRSPEVAAFYECKRPEASIDSCKYSNEITSQLVLEDLSGNEIFSSKIVGFGIENFAIFDSLSTKFGKPLQLAINDHFKNLSDTLQSAPEIRLFESCSQVDCNSLLRKPSILPETLKRIENTRKRKKIVHRLIYMAIEKDNIDLLSELLSTKLIDLNQPEKYYKILPIHMAAKRSKMKACDLLIANGSDINKGDNNGWTALHYAAFYGHTELLKYLIHQGAVINVKNSDGQTPFILAITSGNRMAWQLLIDNNADYNAVDENDLLGTALLYKEISNYFYLKNKKTKFDETSKIASEYFQKASLFYSEISEKAKSKAFVKDLAKFLLIVAYEVGSSYQSQIAARQNAEIGALVKANKMGLPQTQTLSLIHEYKFNSHNTYNPSTGIVWNRPDYDSDTLTLKDIANEYSILSKKCLEYSDEVKQIAK